MEKVETIAVKVKTMDEAIFDYQVATTDKILDLKEKILSELGVPINRQRIVFMGKLLKDHNDFEHYNVQDGNVLHLIANLEERAAQEDEENVQAEEANEPNYEEDEAVFNERGEQEILAGIFRTLSDTSLNRRNYRRRMLQRRLAGFNVDSKESLEVIRQNLLTVSQLDRDRVSSHGEVKPVSEIKGFDFSERKLEIGQWIDIKDTIDQWLEGEVIDINETQVFVHYNGWGRRWDEWIDMNSPRIAAFRTHTVQSPYSMFMSPNPAHSLDGDHSNVPEISNKIENIVDGAKTNNYKLSDMLDELLKSMKKREELIRKRPKEKSERSPITMRIKKRKILKPPKIRRRKTVKKGLGSSEKYSMEKEDRIETQSNFSLKIHENNLSNFRDKDDCHSMKSLKLKKSTEADTEKDKDNDSMSSKSFKSQMSSNLNFNFPDYISEERSIDDEEYERDIQRERKAHDIEVKKANQELKTRCAQLAPIMERMGRMLIDLAPHVAMVGSNLFQPCTNTVSGISMHTIDGSQMSQNIHNDPIQRLLHPQNNGPSSLGRRTISAFTNMVGNNNPNLNTNDLSSGGRTLDFEIPVMLNPGELLSVTPRQDNLVGDGNVHLHLNAQVHLPERDAGEYLANETPNNRPDTRDMAAQTDFYQRERRASGFTGSIASPKNPENVQSPLLKSLTKNPSEIRNFAYPQNSPFTQSKNTNGLQSLPSFGGLRHTTSEGPKDTEPSEIPSIKKYNKRSGMSIMREEDLNRELLDNSLHGTIEERDENEEPEMQDISFRDLDFGVDIIENEEIDENDEFDLKDDDEIGEVFLGKAYSHKKEAIGNKSVDDNNLNIFNDPPKSENLGSNEASNKLEENLSSNFSLENKEKELNDSDRNLSKSKSGSSMKSDLI